MSRLFIKGAKVLLGPPDDWKFNDTGLLCEDGRIVGSAQDAQGVAETLLLEGAYLLPGFIDQHTHAAIGIDTSECNAEGLDKLSHFYASKGVACFLPTLTTLGAEVTLERLSALSEASPTGAAMLGIHMEGPCLNMEFRGAQSLEFLKSPSVELFRQWLDLGSVKLVTLAPELDDAIESIRFLREQGVAVNIGHSNATFAQCGAAMQAGVGCVSHFLNGMRLFHQHEPSIMGCVILSKTMYAELICDGFHLVPDTVRVMERVLGFRKIILITDSILAAGLPDGRYEAPCFSEPLIVENGDARLLSGTRAGSTATMDRVFRNFIAFTGCRIEDAARCASANPAMHLGLFQELGSIEFGKRACLTALDENLQVLATVVDGNVTYRNPTQENTI